MGSEVDISYISKFTSSYFWMFVSMLVLVVVCKILLNTSKYYYLDRIYSIMSSNCTSEFESELFNFENEEEKKLFYLTRIYTRINKNVNYDLHSIADKGSITLKFFYLFN